MNEASNQHSSWEVVQEAAYLAAAAHEGPSDMTTADYSTLVDRSVQEVSGLLEQLEAAQAEAELKRIETHHANAKRQSIEEQLEVWKTGCDEYIAQRNQEMQRATRLEEQNETLREALAFYADPETYFAIAFMADPPCGEFADDFEELDGALGHPDGGAWTKPGKRAREAYAAVLGVPYPATEPKP